MASVRDGRHPCIQLCTVTIWPLVTGRTTQVCLVLWDTCRPHRRRFDRLDGSSPAAESAASPRQHQPAPPPRSPARSRGLAQKREAMSSPRPNSRKSARPLLRAAIAVAGCGRERARGGEGRARGGGRGYGGERPWARANIPPPPPLEHRYASSGSVSLLIFVS